MKKIKIFFWVSIICSGLVGCKYLSKITSETENNTNTEIEIDNIKIDKMTSEYLIEVKKSDADTKWTNEDKRKLRMK